MEAAPSVEAVLAEMAAEGAEEVDEGTQRIVEEDLCTFAALVIMPLDHTVLYITHRPGPLAAETSAGPVIDVSAQPCAPKDCPFGPFVHEEEELEAPTPKHFGGGSAFTTRLHCDAVQFGDGGDSCCAGASAQGGGMIGTVVS